MEVQLELEVCRTTWVRRTVTTTFGVEDNWTLEVELTVIPTRFESIHAFNKWYDKITR